jgi:hypothetical protein
VYENGVRKAAGGESRFDLQAGAQEHDLAFLPELFFLAAQRI